MLEYPIFKHLIQFSNLVDSKGNFLVEPVPIGMPPKIEEIKHQDSNETSQEKEGGDRYTYEGGDGDSENGGAGSPQANGNGF